jgi:hypothetical protein
LGLNLVCHPDFWAKIGFELALFGFVPLDIGLKLALIGFELGLFFEEIIVFKQKMGKIGFVLHKKG